MTDHKLRQWRGVKPVAPPAGVSITTRIRTSTEDEKVLDVVADHVGKLRRKDLTAVCHPIPLKLKDDDEERRQQRRDRLNTRKKALTARSSSRWASSIIATNNDQYRLSREAQYRHLVGLRAAVATITKRLKAPTQDTLTAAERRERRKTRNSKGYANKQERFAKQQRLQILQARLSCLESDKATKTVHVVEGGKKLAKNRHDLFAAELTLDDWQQRWDCARYRINAKGSRDEPFGNLTITVEPNGLTSIRLPKPLEHLANVSRGRYVLSGKTLFSYRADDWQERITGGKSVSYTITRKPDRAGRYITAAWATDPVIEKFWVSTDTDTDTDADTEVYTDKPVVGVDLNADHLALRRLDVHGNPVGAPERIDIDCTGTSSRRNAQVRHAITRLLHYAHRFDVDTIAIEDLNFTDARDIGRETMGRGQRGKSFRRTVSGIPTAVFRDRLTAQAHRHDISVLAGQSRLHQYLG